MSMQKVWWITKKQHGFSAVEALLAATVFAFLVSGLIGAIIYGRATTADSGIRNRATYLAEEGIEAARNIGNAAYGNLANGTYGIAQSGGVWTFSGASDSSDIYTRQVTIADAGADRKLITSIVTWARSNGATSNVTLTSRVSNWEAAIVPPTSWANAILASSIDLSGTVDPVKIATNGNYAYIIRGSGTSNFTVINVSNPTSPTIVGNLTLAGTPANIDVSGNYAYIANGGDSTELQIVNISNPAAPSLTSTVNMAGTANATGVDIVGTTAYVSRATSTTTGSNELTFVNVATPASPTVAGGYNNTLTMNGVYVNGSYAYLPTSSTSSGMLVVNVSNLASPTLTATYNPGSFYAPTTIAGSGTTVYIGFGLFMDAINVSNPASPTRIGQFTIGGFSGAITDIALHADGDYAFISTSSSLGEFQVVNTSSPAAMSAAKVIDTAGTGTVNGVAYNSSLDLVVGASIINTQEFMVFTKN